MSKLNLMCSEIDSFYHELKVLKKIDDNYKQLLKNHLDKSPEKELTINNVILHTKSRTSSNWDKEVYDHLFNLGLLHLAVSLKGDELNRYDLEDYKFKPEKSLKLSSPKLTKNDISFYYSKHLSKISGDEIILDSKTDPENFLLDFLNEFDINSIVNFFKLNRINLKSFEQKLEKRRESIKEEMIATNTNTFSTKNGFKFSLYDKKPEFDVEKIFQNQIAKMYKFKYKIQSKIDSGKEITVKDAFRDNEITVFNEETDYYGQKLSLYKSRIHINNQRLHTDLKELFESKDREFNAIGHVFVDGDDLFRNMPISSTKIDELIDSGLLDESILSFKKYDFSTKKEFFEAITEDSDQARRNMFKDKMEKRRALKIEREKTVYKVEDYETEEDQEIEDLFLI